MDSQFKVEPRLVIIDGNDKGKVVVIKPGSQTLGRSKADIKVNDVRVSRMHFSINFDSQTGKVSFTDLNSLNGTMINGVELASGDLKDGDQILLGDTRLDLQILAVAPEITAQKHLAEMLKYAPGPPMESPDAAIGSPDSLSLEEGKPMVSPPPSLGVRTRPRLVRGFLAGVLLLGGAAYFLYQPLKKPEELNAKLKAVAELVSRDDLDRGLFLAIQNTVEFPESVKAHLQVGYVYTRLKKYELAIGAYQKAHALDGVPGVVHARLLRLYGLVDARQGIANEMGHIDKILKDGPYDRDTFVELAMCFLELKDIAGDQFERPYILAKALQKEVAPGDSVGYKLEAQVLATQKRYAETVEPLKRAIELSPNDQWPWENLTFAYLKSGSAEDTASVVTEWARRFPQSVKPLLVQAYMKLNSERVLEALPYAQRVIELRKGSVVTEPEYAEALSIIGTIYAKQGQNAEATQSLGEACRLGHQPACDFGKPSEKASVDEVTTREATSEANPTPTDDSIKAGATPLPVPAPSP